MRPPANVDADDDHNGDAADLAVWHMPFSSSPTIVASASRAGSLTALHPVNEVPRPHSCIEPVPPTGAKRLFFVNLEAMPTANSLDCTPAQFSLSFPNAKIKVGRNQPCSLGRVSFTPTI